MFSSSLSIWEAEFFLNREMLLPLFLSRPDRNGMRTFPVSTTPTQNPVKDITHLLIHPPTTPRRHTSPTARQHTLRTCCPPGPCQKVSGRKSTNPHSFRAEDRSTCRRRASAARPGGAPPPCGVESLGAAPQRRWCSTWVFVSEGGDGTGWGQRVVGCLLCGSK